MGARIGVWTRTLAPLGLLTPSTQMRIVGRLARLTQVVLTEIPSKPVSTLGAISRLNRELNTATTLLRLDI